MPSITGSRADRAALLIIDLGHDAFGKPATAVVWPDLGGGTGVEGHVAKLVPKAEQRLRTEYVLLSSGIAQPWVILASASHFPGLTII